MCVCVSVCVCVCMCIRLCVYMCVRACVCERVVGYAELCVVLRLRRGLHSGTRAVLWGLVESYPMGIAVPVVVVVMVPVVGVVVVILGGGAAGGAAAGRHQAQLLCRRYLAAHASHGAACNPAATLAQGIACQAEPASPPTSTAPRPHGPLSRSALLPSRTHAPAARAGGRGCVRACVRAYVCACVRARPRAPTQWWCGWSWS